MLRKLWLILVVALSGVLSVPGQPTAAELVVVAEPGARIQEFVISVSDLQRTLPAFTEVLQWRMLHRGRADPTVARAWGLDVDTEIEEALVGSAAADRGFLRLVQIKDADQVLIRPGGRWWDTGGWFNVEARVANLDATVAGLRERGWHSIGLPPSDRAGQAALARRALMVGPDAVVLSLWEVQAASRAGRVPAAGAGYVTAGYQVVSDIETWRAFYVTLGLSAAPIIERRNADPVGPNEYGLPHNATRLTDHRQVTVLLPEDGHQSLVARQHLNATGYDFSGRAAPPNLGIMTARFPTADALGLAERLRRAGVVLAADTQIVRLAPYGTARILAVRAPGGSGAWLELFEPNVEPASRAELVAFFAPGRFARWTRFNNRLTGTVEHRADGTAHVSWRTGLDEEGVWMLKGNTLCTAWHRLRDFREQCAHYYRIGATAYQSFTVTGRPDGLLYWR